MLRTCLTSVGVLLSSCALLACSVDAGGAGGAAADDRLQISGDDAAAWQADDGDAAPAGDEGSGTVEPESEEAGDDVNADNAGLGLERPAYAVLTRRQRASAPNWVR